MTVVHKYAFCTLGVEVADIGQNPSLDFTLQIPDSRRRQEMRAGWPGHSGHRGGYGLRWSRLKVQQAIVRKPRLSGHVVSLLWSPARKPGSVGAWLLSLQVIASLRRQES